MWKFCTLFFPGVELTTFLENCGLGDLIVATIAGRNRLVAEKFVTAGKVSCPHTCKHSTGVDWTIIVILLLSFLSYI